jgi:hypothetical protein
MSGLLRAERPENHFDDRETAGAEPHGTEPTKTWGSEAEGGPRSGLWLLHDHPEENEQVIDLNLDGRHPFEGVTVERALARHPAHPAA